jgi:hypothetical protein
MKKLTLILTLLFSTVMFSSTSFAEWTKVGGSVEGDTLYVDFERIRKHGGYVYYWDLSNFFKPIGTGVLSSKVYKQGDCKLFRFKWLSRSHHTQPMGDGTPFESGAAKNQEWIYPNPNSVDERILESVCSR